MLRLAIQLHKWIALVVGIQVLGWVLGGLIMTALPIQKVRSEQHIAVSPPKPLDLSKILPLAEVARRAGKSSVDGATLKSTPADRSGIWTRPGTTPSPG